MFGFQRVGDLIWALGDMRGRGILAGCTAGRTTLQGEGLQHDDGHSPLLASANPAVAVYDPAFAYEVAVIVEDAIRRMFGPEPEDRFWYLTLYNENYLMPALPEGPARPRVRVGASSAGIYRFAEPADEATRRPRPGHPPASRGPLWQAAMEARRLLADDWGVGADAWSATSYKSLRDDAVSAERWNRLHPDEPSPGRRYVTAPLGRTPGPVVAVTDFMRAVPDQVSRWVPRPFLSLGTDGFGRSDAREALRRFFEVDAAHVVVAVLDALAARGPSRPRWPAAIRRYGIDPGRPTPGPTERSPGPGRSTGTEEGRRPSAGPVALFWPPKSTSSSAQTHYPPTVEVSQLSLHLSQSDEADALLSKLRTPGPAHRHGPRPADPAGASLPRPLRARGAAGRDPRRREPWRPWIPTPWRRPSAARPALHRFPGQRQAGPAALPAVADEYGSGPPAIWETAKDGTDLLTRVKALPGFGEQKARLFIGLLGKQLGVKPTGWQEAASPFGEAGTYRSVADIHTGRSRWPRSGPI